MTRDANRAYSRYSREAAALLGKLIRQRRLEQRMSAQALADRAGISRGVVQRIERGDMGCAVGSVFEVAAIVGVPLFDASLSGLKAKVAETDKLLRLLPQSARQLGGRVPDGF